MLFVKPCGANQDDGEDQGRRMKLEKAAHLPGLAGIINHVVCVEQKPAEPYIEKKIGEKSRQIEDVLFDRNWLAERESMDAESGAVIWVAEEPLRENQVEPEAERNQNGEGPPESALRNVLPFAGQEPSCDDHDWDDEQQKAHRVAMRRGALVDGNQWHGSVHRMQRENRRNNDHRQHRDHNSGADRGAGKSVRAGCGHERPPVRDGAWTF